MVIVTLLLFLGAVVRNKYDITRLIFLLSEFLALDAFLICLRSTTVFATTLPSPSPLCRGIKSWADRPSEGYFLATLDCNDSMFSGHTTGYAIVFVMWMSSFVPWYVKILYFVFFLVSCFISTATADHYTIDVLVAIYICCPIAWYRRHAYRNCFGRGSYIFGEEAVLGLWGGIISKLE